MLVELAAWRPRWYYVMKNVTSGVCYVGQTFNLHTRNYCGSGQYWVAHCNKHGGHNRRNIKIVEEFFADTKEAAEKWLEDFEKLNPDYWVRSNTTWANRAKETTKDSGFCGIPKEQRVEYASMGAKAMANLHPNLLSENGKVQGTKNVESGHMARIQKVGCVLGGKVSGPILGRKMVESGHLDRIKKLGGKAVCEKRHAEKDLATGKSKFAVQIGKASGITRGLMSEFCKEHGIKNPGINYINIDRQAFNEWRGSRDC